MLLVGDIGGTNSRFALFEYKWPLKLLKEDRFLSTNYDSIHSAIKHFLENEKIDLKAASFGIAGPVKEGRCKATNIPWMVDVSELKEELNCENVYLLNDLEANAYGIEVLNEDEFYTINEGEKNVLGNRCLVAAGTGLGEAGLYFDGKKYRPFACEGGHTDFGPRNDIEIELLKYLREEFGHVSYERILSGPGLYSIYKFLIDRGYEQRVSSFDHSLASVRQPQVLITQKGMKKEIKVCEVAVDLFISIYGAEAGNAALKFFALGGVYIGGGIAPKMLEKIKEEHFMRAFSEKGRFSDFMRKIPVKVILNDKAALLGAAQYALIHK
ncbi:MAG: glucokinase [Parachlamydiales bacterium]|nr:glucokinase [Parachlamydiales bacterium]